MAIRLSSDRVCRLQVSSMDLLFRLSNIAPFAATLVSCYPLLRLSMLIPNFLVIFSILLYSFSMAFVACPFPYLAL